MILSALSVALLVRLSWSKSPTLHPQQRWQVALFSFLLPPLLLLTTAFAILCMGWQGQMLGMGTDSNAWPEVRGKLLKDAPLAPYTWFRVGGAADALFLPADQDDLRAFLKALPEEIPVTVLGVGSNTIVRDGGIEGVVIRLMGGYWGAIEIEADRVSARAGALDLSVAKSAAKAGVAGLSFLSGIPGSIGGAVRTNAGCYGHELSDVVTSVEGISRAGEPVHLDRKDIGFSYRHTDFATNIVVTQLHLKGAPGGDPETLAEEIAAHQKRRAETQPIKDKTGGSTFANPDPPGTPEARSSWKLIDAAGCRGLRVGGAMRRDGARQSSGRD